MNYTATQWSTAEEKAWFVDHFIKFVEKGFPKHLFTKKFYNRLSNTFGHIAHYNQLGFWETFFETTRDKVAFLEQTMNSCCYGDPEYTYVDAEKEIKRQLEAKGLVKKYLMMEMQEEHDKEYAEYQRLKSKFETA